MQVSRKLPLAIILAVAPVFTVSHSLAAVIKADNNTTLQTAGSWSLGVAPVSTDIAQWDNTILTAGNTANTLSSSTTWAGIKVVNPPAAVSIGISGTNTLTMGASGIDLSTATQDLSITGSTAFLRTATSASQSFNVPTGRTLTVSSALLAQGGTTTITLPGVGNVNLNGNTTNGGGVVVISETAAGTLTFGGSGTSSFRNVDASNSGSVIVNGNSLTLSGGTVSTYGSSSSSAKFELQAGSAAFNSGIRTNSSDGTLIKVSGGTFSATDVQLQRTVSNLAFTTSASSTSGFVVTGGSATVGTLRIATNNSSATSLVNGGSLTATGQVTIGGANTGRFSILEVRSGTFSSTDTVNGVTLSTNTSAGNGSEFLVNGGTSTVERIAFGASGSAGTGFVVVNGGTLYMGSGGILLTSGSTVASTINLTSGILGAKADWSSILPMNLNGSSFTIQTADATATPKNITLSGALSGGGNLNKTGGGTLTLSNTNGYSGSTSVSAGKLVVNGSIVSNTSLSSSAILGGTGTISGTVSIADATLAPGNSAGTLTISNSLSLGSSSNLNYELLGTNMTIGSGINDLTTGVTNLTLDGTLNVTETTAGSFLSATLGNSWRLANYSGSLTDNGLNLGTLPTLSGGLNFAVDTATSGQVNLVVVPEPTTLAIIGLGFGALLRRRRESL